jgi:two-component system LytT family response regulator
MAATSLFVPRSRQGVATRVGYWDCRLKPIEPERLAAALHKLQVTPPAASREAHKYSPLEQLFVRDGPRCWFIPLREISVFSAESNYVRMQWGPERPLSQ